MNARGAPAGADLLTVAQILHGDGPVDPEPVELHAGALTAQLQGVELAYVRLGDRELVRRIHVTVRDENWDTILPSVHALDIEELPDRVAVVFSARNESGAIAFSWVGRIELAADGSVRYEMDGRAARGFRYCRIGFCVLHDADSHAGRPYRASAPGLPSGGGTLPRLIAPQLYRGGIYLPAVPAYTHLEVDLAGGLGVRFDFEGELFELEDQRNWTDASFKTYCTPANKGYPFDAQPGQRVHQRVSMSSSRTSTTPRRAPARGLEIGVGKPSAHPLPAIGAGLTPSPAALSDREAEVLRALAPSHLRVEAHLGDPQAATTMLATAAAASSAVGAPLELVLFGSPDDAGVVVSLLSPLSRAGVGVARVLAFDEVLEVTPAALIEALAPAIRDAGIDAPIGGGSDVWFAEVHREPPDASVLDVLSFSITPEVHAFDDRSLVETLAVQAHVVRAASALAPGLPVVISPVTLRPRNSAITVDSRQRSLFCAAWTVGSIRYLAEGGAAAVTFYETTGLRGIMEGDAGSSAHGDYPALAGIVFPVYHVLAHACSLKGGAWCPTSSSDPSCVDSYAASTEHATHVAVANMRAVPQRVRLRQPGGRDASVRVLDAATAARAMTSPRAFAGECHEFRLERGALDLELGPHAVAFIEIAREQRA